MAHGHLIAMKGAPILDWRGLLIVAFWGEDQRGPQFTDRVAWNQRSTAMVRRYDDDAQNAVMVTRHSARVQFSRGECQIWQMENEVKQEDMDLVFASPMFRRAQGSDPNDKVRVHAAARTLLNAHRTHLSYQTREELTFLADRLHHQIEAQTW